MLEARVQARALPVPTKGDIDSQSLRSTQKRSAFPPFPFTFLSLQHFSRFTLCPCIPPSNLIQSLHITFFTLDFDRTTVEITIYSSSHQGDRWQ